MHSIKLIGIYGEFKTNLESGQMVTYTPDELVAQLANAEWGDGHNRGIEQKIKNARFLNKADLDNLYYDSGPSHSIGGM
ncbi:hypothetical protein LQ567_16405 [Niabella pedocola]|uniref:Uncharacterized protein n=1 Tax=Niabella pedocola TaxID=1752077 RepID=A0ABS8PTG7_9BACT|nr:hypothetical protein [Niabella pedocola]MCD2424363.1 hypothetical protein [Niabella pedocola]